MRTVSTAVKAARHLYYGINVNINSPNSLSFYPHNNWNKHGGAATLKQCRTSEDKWSRLYISIISSVNISYSYVIRACNGNGTLGRAKLVVS